MERSRRRDGTADAPPLLHSLSAFAALNAYPPSNGALYSLPHSLRSVVSIASRRGKQQQVINLTKLNLVKGMKDERGDCVWESEGIKRETIIIVLI